jgi:hypothetical protein
MAAKSEQKQKNREESGLSDFIPTRQLPSVELSSGNF